MMKRNRLIFYSVFGVLHLLIVAFAFYMDWQKGDFEFLYKMLKLLPWLKYCSLVLLVLFAVNVILHYRDNRRHKKEIDQLNLDCDALKVKLYDQQADKKS